MYKEKNEIVGIIDDTKDKISQINESLSYITYILQNNRDVYKESKIIDNAKEFMNLCNYCRADKNGICDVIGVFCTESGKSGVYHCDAFLKKKEVGKEVCDE